MARILPVKLPLSSKVLWFDANGVEAVKGDDVIVLTARGNEFGTVSDAPFEATPEQLSSLKSALKPVRRLATEEDVQTAHELHQRGLDAMPAYRELVEEEGLEMRPISVEFLFDGDKAVFYFESEDRVDFRELVRKLASQFKVRVDMRQIGVRDEARMVGGLGHCGQELCCKRLGGEFCPVSIRMAKEQDLSLNPQKISGICGRLMCCLRYEYDAYKDFKARAPKVGAQITTPDGLGKVITLDVPKEIVTIQVADDKKIKVPLADMSKSKEEVARPDAVEEEAWGRATNKEDLSLFGGTMFSTSQFTSDDKLGEAKAVHRETGAKKNRRAKGQGKDSSSSASRLSRRDRDKENAAAEQAAATARKPRRRSTKVAGGVAVVKAAEGAPISADALDAEASLKQTQAEQGSSRRPRRRNRSQAASGAPKTGEQTAAFSKSAGPEPSTVDSSERSERRRRRSSKTSSGMRNGSANNGSANNGSVGNGGPSAAGSDRSLRPGHRSSSLRQRAVGKADSEGASSPKGEAPLAQGEEKRPSRRRPRRRRSSNQGPSAEKSE